jgi:hypothetical protein
MSANELSKRRRDGLASGDFIHPFTAHCVGIIALGFMLEG